MTTRRSRSKGSTLPAGPACDGILLVDKPADWTSHDVVAKIRSHFRIRKVGHGGTLDPMATGLLVILLGRGTKLSERVMGSDKGYEGVMTLGRTTDTHDADGQVVAEADPSGVTLEALQAEFAKWTGDIMQVPPMVSALKKDGVPLYKLARKGQTIERKPRLLHLFEFELLAFHPPDVSFRLLCTKGTYVRTLSHDIGQALGCGAHLTSLRRTRSGRLSVEQAHPLKKITDLDIDGLMEIMIPVHRAPQDALG